MTTKTTKTTTRRPRNTFRKIAGSTYACAVCGRKTRNTGVQSLGSKTCPQCYELAGIENEISDGFATLEERRAQIDGYLAEIVEKGGDVSDWSHQQPQAAPVAVEQPICGHKPANTNGVACTKQRGHAGPHGDMHECWPVDADGDSGIDARAYDKAQTEKC